MKTTLKFAALFLVLFAAIPRVGFVDNKQFYVASCSFQVLGSIGLNGVGHAYFDHNNPFSPIGMQVFGC